MGGHEHLTLIPNEDAISSYLRHGFLELRPGAMRLYQSVGADDPKMNIILDISKA